MSVTEQPVCGEYVVEPEIIRIVDACKPQFAVGWIKWVVCGKVLGVKYIYVKDIENCGECLDVELPCFPVVDPPKIELIVKCEELDSECCIDVEPDISSKPKDKICNGCLHTGIGYEITPVDPESTHICLCDLADEPLIIPFEVTPFYIDCNNREYSDDPIIVEVTVGKPEDIIKACEFEPEVSYECSYTGSTPVAVFSVEQPECGIYRLTPEFVPVDPCFPRTVMVLVEWEVCGEIVVKSIVPVEVECPNEAECTEPELVWRTTDKNGTVIEKYCITCSDSNGNTEQKCVTVTAACGTIVKGYISSPSSIDKHKICMPQQLYEVEVKGGECPYLTVTDPKIELIVKCEELDSECCFDVEPKIKDKPKDKEYDGCIYIGLRYEIMPVDPESAHICLCALADEPIVIPFEVTSIYVDCYGVERSEGPIIVEVTIDKWEDLVKVCEFKPEVSYECSYQEDVPKASLFVEQPKCGVYKISPKSVTVDPCSSRTVVTLVEWEVCGKVVASASVPVDVVCQNESECSAPKLAERVSDRNGTVKETYCITCTDSRGNSEQKCTTVTATCGTIVKGYISSLNSIDGHKVCMPTRLYELEVKGGKCLLTKEDVSDASACDKFTITQTEVCAPYTRGEQTISVLGGGYGKKFEAELCEDYEVELDAYVWFDNL